MKIDLSKKYRTKGGDTVFLATILTEEQCRAYGKNPDYPVLGIREIWNPTTAETSLLMDCWALDGRFTEKEEYMYNLVEIKAETPEPSNPSTAHPHAAKMLEYAQDAAETDRPWERWEYNLNGERRWRDLMGSPAWDKSAQYRRKQPEKLYVKIGDKLVEAPLREFPKHEDWYYIADFSARRVVPERFDKDNPHNAKFFRRVGCRLFPTRESAQAAIDVVYELLTQPGKPKCEFE